MQPIHILALGLVITLSAQTFGQIPLSELREKIVRALTQRDEEQIKHLTQQIRATLGDKAGVPEVDDEFRSLAPRQTPWKPEETTQALEQIEGYIRRNRWWKVGLDPTQTNHALREVAMIIDGSLAVADLEPARRDHWLGIATEAGDFLISAQDQAELGLFPFPAVRNGKGKPFEVAEAFMRRAEKQGKLETILRNGWLVQDLGDGGLQFDNGEAGAAMLHLYEATKNPKYLASARRSAEWARQQPLVVNWNYNSFTVYLLAEMYRVTQEEPFLRDAKERALLGVLPGQLSDGPHKGRWLDPHNARPAYHYIMIRSLLALAPLLPNDDPARAKIMEAIRLAMQARNPDYKRGIINGDSALEALLRCKRLPDDLRSKLKECDVDEALSALGDYAVERWRAKQPAIGVGAWCEWLRYHQHFNVPNAATLIDNPQLKEKVDAIRGQHQIPALWVGKFYLDGRSAVAVSGARRWKSEALATIDDPIHLGSCTKAMTGLIIAQLCSEGKLKFESQLSEIFPNDVPAESAWGNVTVQELLQHRSGLRANVDWWKLMEGEKDVVTARNDLLHTMTTGRRPKNRAFLYSNVGYTLLGHIAEKVEKKSWEEIVKERIFEPLKMSSAGFGPILSKSENETSPEASQNVDVPFGHTPVSTVAGLFSDLLKRKTSSDYEPVQIDNAPSMGPAGRVHATLSDWAKFTLLFADPNGNERCQVTKQDWKKLLESSGEEGYAGGWIVTKREWGGGRVYTHAGSNTTWYCVVFVAPEKEYCVMAATNAYSKAAEQACDEVLQTAVELEVDQTR